MRRIILGVIFCFYIVSSFAQTSISEARSRAVGSTVTVSGTVINGSELGTVRYIQDESAGIAVYDSKLVNTKPGDSITVTGMLDDYNNLLEIQPVSNVVIVSSGNSLPEPKILSIDEIGEEYEARLVKIENIKIVGSSGVFSGNQNYDFTDGVYIGELRINSNSPIVGQPIPSVAFNLVAICSQFSQSNNDTQTGYQLLPRTTDDLVSQSSVNFTTPVKVISLTKNSIALGWQTDNGAVPFVRYGFSNSADSLKNIKQGDSATSDEHNLHVAEITGLQAAEVIYAQAFMVLGSDTAFSSVQAYVTESNSKGAMKAYFNSNVDQSFADPTLAIDLGDHMEDTLAAYINRAEQTIDIALYNFDNQTVSAALNAAYERGVRVRFITCGSTAHYGTQDLNTGISVLERPEVTDGGIMHNKFAVFDANSAAPDKAWLWSGSTNLTSAQLYTDANNMIFIQDQSLAKSYQIEFEEMWGSTGAVPNNSKSEFGEAKTDNTPHEFLIDGMRVEMYFSPSDNTNQHLIDAIETADDDLYVETMLITRSDLSGAILNAYDRGVNVYVLTDNESDNAPFVNEALSTNLPAGKYVFDDFISGILHHKVAIIDVTQTDSDPQVITGSHNWSTKANEQNDENTLIIHNTDLANQYLQEFAYRFQHNNGNLIVGAQIVETPGLSVFPNPSSGQLHIKSGKKIKTIQLFSLRGDKIRQWNVASEYEVNLHLPAHLSGMFILKVTDDEATSNVFKLIKK